MSPLYLQGNNQHPTIIFDPSKGQLSIEGKSVPPDGKTFYEPVLDWLDAYSGTPAERTVFSFSLEYFNISSSKMLLFILYKLNDLKQKGHEVLVKWYYFDEEDEMFEVGEDYAFMVDLPFEFIKLEGAVKAS